MAKAHIKDLARILAGKYDEINNKMEEAGLALADTMLSPEEQERFSYFKNAVDGALSTLTISLSAAAQGKLAEVYNQVKAQQEAFTKPLQDAVDDLAKPDIPEDIKQQTMELIASYNAQIRHIEETLYTIRVVEYWMNFVSNRKKQRKYFREMFCKGCARGLPACINAPVYRSLEEQKQAAYVCYTPFKQVNEALQNFEDYVRLLQQEPDENIVVDDMSE